MNFNFGNWKIDWDWNTAIMQGKKHIAMVNHFKCGDPEVDVWGEEHEAIAYLIHAAPDLLEACKHLVEPIGADENAMEYLNKSIQLALDAIAKAENKNG